MPVSRAALRTQLDEFRAALTTPGIDRFSIWNARVDAIRNQADSLDSEWLADQLDNLGYDLGLPVEAAYTTRMLASKGMIAWNDASPSGGPYPYFKQFSLHRPEGLASSQAESDALTSASVGGGHGPWTWGYQKAAGVAWFSDSRPGATADQVNEGLLLFRAELAARDLHICIS